MTVLAVFYRNQYCLKKIMKKTIYILFLFFSLNLLAQSNKGKVTYKVTRNIDKKSGLQKTFISTFKNYENISDEFEFHLIFDSDTAVFQLKEKLFSDKYTAEIALAMIEYYGPTKQTEDSVVTEQKESYGDFLVKRNHLEWELLNETKKIDEYLCFKAKASYKINNGVKDVVHEFVAWYSPQLPYRFGPNTFGNLPGLIIELQAKNYTFGVSKIEFSNKLKLPKLKKFKQITQKELIERIVEDENK